MKPRLLLISAIPPFPKTSGGATRIRNTIRVLSKRYSIYFITFNSPENIFYHKYTSKFINLKLNSKTIFTPIPYHFSPWYNSKLKTLIPNILKKYNIKTIQIEFTQLLYLIKYIPSNVKTVFTAHDISTISFFRRTTETKNLIKFLTSAFSAFQVLIYEKLYLHRFHQIITVSQTDHQYLQKYFKLPSTTLPNGIEKINFIKKQNSKIIKIGYFGSGSHPPNKYAISYILTEIIPRLQKEHQNFKFYLAGNNPDIKDPNITNLGIVPNVSDFFEKIDILVAPIFSGSGTRIKILEALSFGIPVVTTTIGAEGLDIKGKFLQIANQPKDFIYMISNFPKLLPIDFKQLKTQLQPYLWSNIFKHGNN